MASLKESVHELNAMISEFRFMEALDKFYAEDVVSHENEREPLVGLKQYKEAGQRYIDNVSNFSAELKNVIVSDHMTVSEWHYIFDHKEWGHWDAYQLSLRRWKNGKIVHERHHYKEPGA